MNPPHLSPKLMQAVSAADLLNTGIQIHETSIRSLDFRAIDFQFHDAGHKSNERRTNAWKEKNLERPTRRKIVLKMIVFLP